MAGRRRIKDGADVLKRSYPEISGLRTPEDWERAYVVIEDDYLSGKHLIENLGADRHMDPHQTMTILVLRQKMIQDLRIQHAAEYKIMDNALMAYYNSMRLQRMHGDLVTQVERELFHDDSLGVRLKEGGILEINKLKIEEMLNRASGNLMNLINSANNMMLRNFKALREPKSGILLIQAHQVNIAQRQFNQVIQGKGERDSRDSLENSPDEPSTAQ